ncbi:MAG: hypothetical protein HKN74_10320 [Acidimicrobiia bacterium]|nr:hypothetical protein [Acidimicrobiia bacterium]NNF10668.1 hypothetical protein [Acidimicrobiia bacterium]NNL70886.1 hypothetical protein [Acidimicrobiia bacterium]
MTQPQLRDLVKASNPVVTHQLLSDERDVRTLLAEAKQRAGNPQPSDDLLERPVERRRDMQTQERPIQQVPAQKVPIQRRRLIPAMAGALAVIVIAVGAWALTRDSEPEVASSPIEVMELFDQNAITADYMGAGDIYTPDATYQFIFVDGQSPEIRFFDELPETAGVPDWDGNGTINELDGFLGLGVEVSIGGTTQLLSCTQTDPATAVCDEVREGFAFKNPDHQATWTIGFVGGLIDSIVIEIGPNDGTDGSAVRTYAGWVGANHPDEAASLVNEFSGELKVTPDNLERHRELVAEWVAQR